MIGNVNVKDMLFKTGWTAAAAAVAYLLARVASLDGEWVPIATSILTFVSTWVRQQLGATPPDAPAVGPLARSSQ